MAYIEVKDFEKFQHYRDRNPPWIKLYNSLLDDYEFGCLQDAIKWQAVGIWLLASRHDNKIPLDEKWIASRINLRYPLDLDALVNAGFITMYHDDSTALSQRKHDDSTALSSRTAPRSREGEGEGEVEGETEGGTPVSEDLEPSLPAAEFEMSETAAADDNIDGLRAEMQSCGEAAVQESQDDRIAGRLRGQLTMIVAGDDVTAWHDPDGRTVPWRDRPRLLRLALGHWADKDDPDLKLRSALRYVIGQQYDPLPLKSSDELNRSPRPGSEAAKVKGDGSDGERPQSRSQRSRDGLSQPFATPEDALEMWEKKNPVAAAEVRESVASELREAGLEDGSRAMQAAFDVRYRDAAQRRMYQ